MAVKVRTPTGQFPTDCQDSGTTRKSEYHPVCGRYHTRQLC